MWTNHTNLSESDYDPMHFIEIKLKKIKNSVFIIHFLKMHHYYEKISKSDYDGIKAIVKLYPRLTTYYNGIPMIDLNLEFGGIFQRPIQLKYLKQVLLTPKELPIQQPRGA